MHEDIQTLFSGLGAKFCCDPTRFAQKTAAVKAFLFDWDGVFNNAAKNEQHSSTFNEVDSMGTNLLRFSYFFSHNSLPITGIISGESNQLAFHFAKREHFSDCYYKVPDKIKAFHHFCHKHQLRAEEVCYFYDDVLDLSIAGVCGLKILVKRRANPLFENYVLNNGMADYITANESGNFAVREACEMLIGFAGNYDEILTERTSFSDIYRQYFNQRQAWETAFFSMKETEIIKGEI